jgi:hypothetical protein
MSWNNRTFGIGGNMGFTFAVCLLLSICISAFATEMEVRTGVTGIWLQPGEQEPHSFTWQSQWIWMDEAFGSDAMLARRTFELSGPPAKAMLRITATSQYQLYINGEYVCRGPARSAPHHQSYDILDITGMLGEGLNTLAVRVHYQREGRSYNFPGRAGLLAQLDIVSNGREISIVTNDSWKVAPDSSWNNRSPRINRFQPVVSDRVDMRRHISGWYGPGFSDTGWPDAEPLMRTTGWPLPQVNTKARALTPPWTSLVPRDIPYLMEKEELAVELLMATPTDDPITDVPTGIFHINKQVASALSKYRQGKEPLVIPASDTGGAWLLLFDFGKVLNGMPKLDIEGPAGAMVDILCAPYLVNDQFTQKVVDSDFRDRLVLSGKRDVWEATYFKPVRYLGIVIQTGNNPVRLHAAGINKIEYPFERKGNILSSDAPWVEKYMEASAKTIRVCTTDGYTDNYRERRQYAQTGFYAALGNYWIFGDLALQRRYLVQVAQEQEGNGIMPAYAPLAGDDFMIILDANCLWIRGLRNYLLYSGDTVTAVQLLPAAVKLMNLLHTLTDSLGLIDHPPYPYWLDHALNDRRGANFSLNGHYLGALEDFAQLLGWLNEPGKELYLNRAKVLRQSLRTYFWDNDRKLYADALIDGKRSDMFSEHANTMALAMNVATSVQADAITRQLLAPEQHDFIKRNSGITMVTPAMSYLLHKGLCNHGYIEESFRMFRERFDRMLVPCTNRTLWEEWWLDGTGRSGTFKKGRTRSDAQTESAFPPALFAEYLLGIRPVKPGMKEVELFYSPAGLDHVEGRVPSPEGDMTVLWDLNSEGSRELVVEVPGAMQVNLDLASLDVPPGRQILINGKPILPGNDSTSFFLMSEGRHRVEF